MLRDIISCRQLVTCEPDDKVVDAARIMANENIGCVMILDNDRPRGLLTDRDIVVRCIAQNVDVSDCTVEQVMSESVVVCKDTDGLFDCIQLMMKNHVRRVPVVDDRGRAVGVVSFDDIVLILGKEIAMFSEVAKGEERSAA